MQTAVLNPKIISIASRKAQLGAITQRDLLEEAELERIANAAIAKHEAKRAEIQGALENGAIVEPGPLGATIKMRKVLILSRRSRRQS